MPHDVLCLRPEADFARAGVTPPAQLTVAYRKPDDPQLAAAIREARALVIPAVGGRLPGSLFEGSSVKLVQVTGAGVDRLDERSDEHTSELQSPCNLVCRLLHEKKNINKTAR